MPPHHRSSPPRLPRAVTTRERALAECVAGARSLRADNISAALPRYAAAAALAPADADVAAMYGVALRSAGRMQDAQRELIRAIALDETRADSYTQLAQTFILVKDHGQAANAFLSAASLRQTDANAWRDAAEAMRLAHRMVEGLAIARHAMSLAPSNPSIASTLALLLHRTGLIDEAMDLCERVRQQSPDDRNLSITYATLLLLDEQHATGWALHERRLELPELIARPFPPVSPRWNGAALQQQHILVRGEQGLGDQVQFVRWATALRGAGASRVTVQCAPPLVRLLQTVHGIDAVVPTSAPAPAHDVHVDVMSLPHLLDSGSDMRRDLVPYVRASPANDVLDARLRATPRTRMRIGLVWGGSPLHAEDQARSIPLQTLLPVLERPDVEVVVLQQGPSRDQLDAIASDVRATMFDVATDCHDMADTAQVLTQCDVLLAVDTSVAHVAGALNVPTWVMVAHPAEWRWGRHRRDCLFYPSTTVLRQESAGDWVSVVRAACQAIDAWQQAHASHDGSDGHHPTSVERPS